MYKKRITERSSLFVNNSYEGESIEEKVDRVLNNGEPIKDGAPLIFTERKEGVLPAYDIRTDRWDIAIDAMDKVSKSRIAKRDSLAKDGDNMKVVGGNLGNNDSSDVGGTKSIQGTT